MKGRSPFRNNSSPAPLKERGIQGVRLSIMLANKTIVLGITGGIAAYKAADIASKLTQAGARVDVVMTESATRFIAPLTFAVLPAGR